MDKEESNQEGSKIVQFPAHRVAGLPRDEFDQIREMLEEDEETGLSPQQEAVIRMRFGIGVKQDASFELRTDMSDEKAKEIAERILAIRAALEQGSKVDNGGGENAES